MAYGRNNFELGDKPFHSNTILRDPSFQGSKSQPTWVYQYDSVIKTTMLLDNLFFFPSSWVTQKRLSFPGLGLTISLPEGYWVSGSTFKILSAFRLPYTLSVFLLDRNQVEIDERFDDCQKRDDLLRLWWLLKLWKKVLEKLNCLKVLMTRKLRKRRFVRLAWVWVGRRRDWRLRQRKRVWLCEDLRSRLSWRFFVWIALLNLEGFRVERREWESGNLGMGGWQSLPSSSYDASLALKISLTLSNFIYHVLLLKIDPISQRPSLIHVTHG